MATYISIVISFLALGVSGTTAWLTLFRLGTVRMTRPTTICFANEAGRNGERPNPKVYLRTLLYATSKRGRIVESMFVRLRRGESLQTFNVWVYGEKSLERGSGVHIGEVGRVCNHHFLLPSDGTHFEFLPGDYTLEVHVSLVGRDQTIKLNETKLSMSSDMSALINDGHYAVYFDWGPDSKTYHAHLRQFKPVPLGLSIGDG